jgi:hypothetical protein
MAEWMIPVPCTPGDIRMTIHLVKKHLYHLSRKRDPDEERRQWKIARSQEYLARLEDALTSSGATENTHASGEVSEYVNSKFED